MGRTDANGVAMLRVAESDVDRISVNRIVVFKRTWAYFIGIPNASEGLTCVVLMKEASRAARGTLRIENGVKLGEGSPQATNEMRR
jgi:hypothetical protein